jgi:hypothetical protein
VVTVAEQSFRPGDRVRVGPTEGTVVPAHDTVRIRLDTGLEHEFPTRLVIKLPGPRPGREWAVRHHTCTLTPQSEASARFTHAQIPGSQLVHWDGKAWSEAS